MALSGQTRSGRSAFQTAARSAISLSEPLCHFHCPPTFCRCWHSSEVDGANTGRIRDERRRRFASRDRTAASQDRGHRWVLSSSAGEWQTWAMKSDTPSYHGYRFPPEIISHAVWLYHRFCVSFRDVEDLLAQRGITVSYEAIRLWCIQFGSEYARRLKRRQGRLGDTWHLGRGLRHHPGTAALSLACRRSRWRRHRHPRPVASRPPGCQTLYPQAVEGSGE